MASSTARSLARVGALVAALSLLTPWYVLEAHGLQGGGKSGFAALGVWSVVLLLLAAAVGSSFATYRWVPPACGAALALLVVVKLVSPPSAASAFQTAQGTTLEQELERAFAGALSNAVGLHYAPAWGIWLAAAGAAAALVGAIVAATEA